MLDFTSALYLGLRHGSGELAAWLQLSSGRPVALERNAVADAVAAELAELQGCERATLGTSTLHLMWDLFGLMADENLSIFMDAGMYEVGRWGVERAAGRGVPAQAFDHFDPASLGSALHRLPSRCRPVITTDGFCPSCGRFAPIAEHLRLARRHSGYLVIDDTQALGIWGASPSPRRPFGRGGGGSLRRIGCGGSDVLLVSSLAKGFGVPIAAMSGSARRIEAFEQRSATRVHCSPPSMAAIHAAKHALDKNMDCGDSLRERLFGLVRRFRERLREVGVTCGPGCFPVQTIRGLASKDAVMLHSALLRRGIRTVLHRGRCEARSRVGFLINAEHTGREIGAAAHAVGSVLDETVRVSADSGASS